MLELEDYGAELGGIYRHYKGHHYVVLGLCRHSESLDPLVIYVQIPGDLESFKAWESTWARPASMWSDQVEWEGQLRERFQLVAMRYPKPPGAGAKDARDDGDRGV